MNTRLTTVLISLIFMSTISACAPEVGSKKWCARMQEKSTGDWTANEATDYAKNCLFK